MGRFTLAALIVIVLLVGVTYVALERDGVIEVITLDTSGEPRVTRIWYVQQDGALFLEAGHPENPWVQDLKHQDTVELKGSNLDGRYLYL